jgi:hypothetical protein
MSKQIEGGRPGGHPSVSTRSRRARTDAVGVQAREGSDSAPAADRANDSLSSKPRPACPGPKSGSVVVDLRSLRPTPDEVEAIAQRLAALLLRAP